MSSCAVTSECLSAGVSGIRRKRAVGCAASHIVRRGEGVSVYVWDRFRRITVGAVREEGLVVASIERTAYPRFRRVVPVRELHESFTPGLAEIDWARERTRSPQHLLALVVLLKSYQKLGYFPDLFDVPMGVIEHVRGYLQLGAELEPTHDSGDPG